ncbi:MAG: electron transfer flavoprotein subunit alpha/FixB family protein [Candidatus Stahlbacteria bacterium]|nr:electron transfer flavoprotein subunit alpha/FixB family protein [Candidatus Stahlbacteria bacterium]
MKNVFALVEHRQDKIRDISYELLTKGQELATLYGGELTALLLGNELTKFIDSLKPYAHRIMIVEDAKLKDFNAESYQIVLSNILKQEQDFLLLMGHTASGMDLGASLSVELGASIATDCTGIEIENDNIIAIRQMYEGKLLAKVNLNIKAKSIITIREGSFPPQVSNLSAKVLDFTSPLTAEPSYRRFVEYIEAPLGEVDITKSDIIIGIGRGIKEKENLLLVEELAKTIGGIVGCSRPIVDAGWLPKDRQVGSSGKTVKPKLYIAIGISGAFQHISGMKGAETIIAINKDPNAPIFSEADYGIVDDLFKVVPILKNKLTAMKA